TDLAEDSASARADGIQIRALAGLVTRGIHIEPRIQLRILGRSLRTGRHVLGHPSGEPALMTRWNLTRDHLERSDATRRYRIRACRTVGSYCLCRIRRLMPRNPASPPERASGDR